MTRIIEYEILTSYSSPKDVNEEVTDRLNDRDNTWEILGTPFMAANDGGIVYCQCMVRTGPDNDPNEPDLEPMG